MGDNLFHFLTSIDDSGERFCLANADQVSKLEKTSGVLLGKHYLVIRKKDQLGKVHSSNLSKVLFEIEEYLDSTQNTTQLNPIESSKAWVKIKTKVTKATEKPNSIFIRLKRAISRAINWFEAIPTLEKSFDALEKKWKSREASEVMLPKSIPAIAAATPTANPTATATASTQQPEPSSSSQPSISTEHAPQPIDQPKAEILPETKQPEPELSVPKKLQGGSLKDRAEYLIEKAQANEVFDEDDQNLLMSCFNDFWFENKSMRLLDSLGFDRIMGLMGVFIREKKIGAAGWMIREMHRAITIKPEYIKSNFFKTPSDFLGYILIAACVSGEVELAKAVIKLNPNINYRLPSDGQTAMHKAVIFKQDEIGQMIAEVGADLTIEDTLGKTAKHYFLERETLN